MLSSVLKLVLSAVLVLQVAECQFNRPCQYTTDCSFQVPGQNAQSLWMTCRKKKCQCESFGLADASSWNFDFSDGKCVIEEDGPCGSDNGLTIECSIGRSCIGGLCRDPDAVGTGEDGDYCNDDADCSPDLRCAVVKFHYQPIRACKHKKFKDNYTWKG